MIDVNNANFRKVFRSLPTLETERLLLKKISPDNALSVARAKQTNKENWVNVKKPYKRQHQELK